MEDLPISSFTAEITKCINHNCHFIIDELRRGTTPERYDILCLMDEAVKMAIDAWKKVPSFMDKNSKYADEHLYPLVKETYLIKNDFNGMEAYIILPKLLIMSGFIALSMNLIKTGEKIFKALKKYRPRTEYPLIGSAFVSICKGNYISAIDILRDEALKINPKSDLARAFLALAYTFSKKHEEMKQLTGEIIENNEDEYHLFLDAKVIT